MIGYWSDVAVSPSVDPDSAMIDDPLNYSRWAEKIKKIAPLIILWIKELESLSLLSMRSSWCAMGLKKHGSLALWDDTGSDLLPDPRTDTHMSESSASSNA